MDTLLQFARSPTGGQHAIEGTKARIAFFARFVSCGTHCGFGTVCSLQGGTRKG